MSCEICSGRGIVRLPVQKSLKEVYSPVGTEDSVVFDALFREYPCPECSPKAKETDISICNAVIDVPAEYLSDTGFVHYQRHSLARSIANLILENNALKVTVGTPDKVTRRVEIHGKCGVVSLSHVSDMEDRIKARQEEIAERVAGIAIGSIQNWGSYYGDKHIDKARASDFIREALRKALYPTTDGDAACPTKHQS